MMQIALSVFLVIVVSFLLNVAFRQSYNLLFFFLKKPKAWIVFVGAMNCFVFYLASLVQASFVIWWASLLVLLNNIPPKVKAMGDAELDTLSDDLTGVRSSRTKYRVGLAAYALGGMAGWLLFHGRLSP